MNGDALRRMLARDNLGHSLRTVRDESIDGVDRAREPVSSLDCSWREVADAIVFVTQTRAGHKDAVANKRAPRRAWKRPDARGRQADLYKNEVRPDGAVVQ